MSVAAPTRRVRPALRRDRENGIIAGVCAGTARTLGVDPIVVRVLIAILTIVPGIGFPM